MAYTANIGTTNILDKNLVITELEDLSVYYQNITNSNVDYYTPSGTEWYTFSGMQLSVAMTTEDVLLLDARVDLSFDSTNNDTDVIVEFGFDGTGGVGSGANSKYRIRAGDHNSDGYDFSVVVRAAWTVTSDATHTYSLRARVLNLPTGGVIHSYQRDLSAMLFKRNNDNNQTFL